MQTTIGSLYEIDQEHKSLLDELTDIYVSQSSGQEVDQNRLDELLNALDNSEGDFHLKATNYAKYDRHLQYMDSQTDAMISSLQQEIKRLEKIKSGRKKTRDGMYDRLLSVMSDRKLKKLELGDDQGYFLRGESKSLDASNMSEQALIALHKAEPEFVTRKESEVTYQPNKTPIKSFLDKNSKTIEAINKAVEDKDESSLNKLLSENPKIADLREKAPEIFSGCKIIKKPKLTLK